MQINISNPCSEDWSSMTNNEKGRFCQNCKKTVVDFSQMELFEIKSYLEQQSNKVCGRIPSHKLDSFNSTYQALPSPSLIRNWTLAAVMTGVISFPTIAQQTNTAIIPTSSLAIYSFPEKISDINVENNNIVTPPTGDSIVLAGKVMDQSGEVLPFVKVSIEGKKAQVSTDFDGLFHLKVPKSAETAIISVYSIGMTPRLISFVPNQSKTDFVIVLEEEELLMGMVHYLSPKEIKKNRRLYRKEQRAKKRKKQ